MTFWQEIITLTGPICRGGMKFATQISPLLNYFFCFIQFRRKPGPAEGETFCSRSGYPEIETDPAHFQDADWQADVYEDYNTGRGNKICKHNTVTIRIPHLQRIAGPKGVAR